MPQTRIAGVETKIVECGDKNKCAGVYVWRSASSASLQVCDCASVQLCTCARVQVCGRTNEELYDLDVR